MGASFGGMERLKGSVVVAVVVDGFIVEKFWLRAP